MRAGELLTAAREHMRRGELDQALAALDEAERLRDTADDAFVRELVRAYRDLRAQLEAG